MNRAARQRVDGVLLVDKPHGMTSQGAVACVKRLYQAAKAGHTGTLDPAATGLLPVCLGEATKFSHMLLDADKGYRATVRLGTTTSTGDLEGDVVGTAEVKAGIADIEAAAGHFRGEIFQIPPMHSALKHEGKALYRYARAGETVVREPRKVTIRELRVLEIRGNDVEIAVRCSKGTYIRVLAEDIGRMLGCGACLAALVRTSVGDFSLEQAASLDQLDAMDIAQRMACLKPVDTLIQSLPRVDLDGRQRADLSQGRTLSLSSVETTGLARLYGPGQEFLGVGEVDPAGRLAPRRLLATDRQALR